MNLRDKFMEEMCYMKCNNLNCKQEKGDIRNCAVLYIWNANFKSKETNTKIDMKDILVNKFRTDICKKRCTNKECKQTTIAINNCATLILMNLIIEKSSHGIFYNDRKPKQYGEYKE